MTITTDELTPAPPPLSSRSASMPAKSTSGAHCGTLELPWCNSPSRKAALTSPPACKAPVEHTIRDAGRAYHPLAVNTIGIGMGLPTVLTYGSEEHHELYLRRIFTGEDFWCQMFSEPSHGSDVAGLSSRAVRDGDESDHQRAEGLDERRPPRVVRHAPGS